MDVFLCSVLGIFQSGPTGRSHVMDVKVSIPLAADELELLLRPVKGWGKLLKACIGYWTHKARCF